MFQVLSFFFVCLWLVPFGFFISLSANDMVLPTIGEEGEWREGGREREEVGDRKEREGVKGRGQEGERERRGEGGDGQKSVHYNIFHHVHLQMVLRGVPGEVDSLLLLTLWLVKLVV